MKKQQIAQIASYFGLGFGHFILGHKLQGAILFCVELIVIFFNLAFIKGIWGLITLGETVQKMDGFSVTQGDHSIFLLVDGVLMLGLLVIILIIYIYNISSVKHIIKDNLQVLPPLKFFKNIYENYFVALILIPAGILFLLFTLMPLIITVLIAFTNYSAPDHIPPRNLVDWVGFKTFTNFFSMPLWSSTFFRVGIWTIVWAISSTFTCYFGGLCLSLILKRKDILFKKVWRTIFILPWAIPDFVSLLVFRLLFSGVGPLNTLLEQLIGFKIHFWSDPILAKITIVLINMWLGVLYFMVMVSAALTNIPADICEAADVDGANAIRKFWNITLPILLLQTSPIIILTFAMKFNNFNSIFLLTNGGPVDSSLQYAGHTDILITWLYKLTLQQNQYNISSVISLLLFVFLAIVSFLQLSKTKSFKEGE